MKRNIIIFVLLLSCNGLIAQEKPDTTKYIYCQLVEHVKKKFVSMDVAIDFGTISPPKDINLYKDSSGKSIVFNTFIDGMNYMADKGWQFVQIYTSMEMSGSTTSLYWVLRKPQK